MSRAWQTVPVQPDTRMALAFAAEIRRQAALLPPGTTAHEPLEPLWAAVLAAAPQPPEVPAAPVAIPRTAAAGWNAAIMAMLDIATGSAAAIAAGSQRPIAESFAVAALEELATAGRALLIVDDTKQPVIIQEEAR